MNTAIDNLVSNVENRIEQADFLEKSAHDSINIEEYREVLRSILTDVKALKSKDSEEDVRIKEVLRLCKNGIIDAAIECELDSDMTALDMQAMIERGRQLDGSEVAPTETHGTKNYRQWEHEKELIELGIEHPEKHFCISCQKAFVGIPVYCKTEAECGTIDHWCPDCFPDPEFVENEAREMLEAFKSNQASKDDTSSNDTKATCQICLGPKRATQDFCSINCHAEQMKRFPQLDEDAPPVPHGMRPKKGVEMGCGQHECSDCYDPIN